MDIENLNKSQTILLTLLVSFVTSIATGIVTITLMDQAPPAITQTIHKVVEKTVETVVPGEQTASVNKVIVVKESDLISDALAKNSDVIVKIFRQTKEDETIEGDKVEEELISYGIVVSKKGIVLTSKLDKDEGNYFMVVKDEKIPLIFLKDGENANVTYFEINDNDNKIFKKVFKEASIVKFQDLKLGETIISLGGGVDMEVSVGIISSLFKAKNFDISGGMSVSSSTDEKIEDGEDVEEDIFDNSILKIKTNISSENLTAGSPLVDLDGNIVGINVSFDDSTFISLDFIQDDLAEE